jgi:hypothetical protein
MKTTIRRPVIKQCPFRNETDTGELVIIFNGGAPELHGLAASVDSIAADPITHEEFTRRVTALVPEAISVTTTWHTGPWSVECSAKTEGGDR